MFVFQTIYASEKKPVQMPPGLVAHLKEFYKVDAANSKELGKLENIITIAIGRGEDFRFSLLGPQEMAKFEKILGYLKEDAGFVKALKKEFALATGEKRNSETVKSLVGGQMDLIAFILAVRSKGQMDVNDKDFHMELSDGNTRMTICTIGCISLSLLDLKEKPDRFEAVSQEFSDFSSRDEKGKEKYMKEHFAEGWANATALAKKICSYLRTQAGLIIKSISDNIWFTPKTFGANKLLGDDILHHQASEKTRKNLEMAYGEIEKEKKRKGKG